MMTRNSGILLVGALYGLLLTIPSFAEDSPPPPPTAPVTSSPDPNPLAPSSDNASSSSATFSGEHGANAETEDGTPAPPPPPAEDNAAAPTPPPPAPADTAGTPAPTSDTTAAAPAPAPTAEPQTIPPPPPPAPVSPEPAAVASDNGGSKPVNKSRLDPEHDPRVPAYQKHKPQWGLELAGSLKALGQNPSFNDATGTPKALGEAKVRAFSVQFEYQPRIFQKFGVLGIGPSFTAYLPMPADNITQSGFSLWSVGAQLRYQIRFFHEQILVPTVGLAMEYLNYRLTNPDVTGRLMAFGPYVGGMFLLNWFEPSAAGDFFVSYNVSRSYLVGEFRMLSGSDPNLSFSGQSIFFGLRIEF